MTWFSPDHINGLFEAGGAIMLARNCLQLYRDKMVRGVHWAATAFFASWGLWNLYYYPSLGQWWSFTGGCALVSFNVFWLYQMAWYGFIREWVEIMGAPDESWRTVEQALSEAYRDLAEQMGSRDTK